MVYFLENSWLLYFTAGLWGLGDAAFNTFPNTMLSVLFTDDAESAFANLKFWASLGTVLPFAAGAYLTIYVKLVSVFGFLWLGAIPLVYLQVFFRGFDKGVLSEERSILNEEANGGNIN